MTFAQMLTEFYARGFDYLSLDAAGQTRAKRMLNESYLELAAAHPWPFLETTVSGTAPLTISNLGDVLYVVDTTNDVRLPLLDVRGVVPDDPDLDDTGSPRGYYLDGSSTLRVWPASTSASLSVRYIKVPAELSADGDELDVPSRFQGLVVDGAVVRALVDSDNYEAAAALQTLLDARVARMSDALFSRSFDSQYVQRAMAHEDGWV
jgi:hypothetical protein